MAVWFVVIGAARPGRDHPAPVRPAGDLAALRDHAVHPVQGPGVRGARRRGAVRHRGRGAVCRHGAFRRLPDPAELDVLRAAVAGAELFRPGRADPARPRGAGQSVLPAGPGLGAAAAGDPGHRGDGDRLAGGDLRRLFDHPAVHAARLPAAHDGAPHLDHRGGPDLCAAGQLGPGGGRAGPGACLQELRRAGRRLRHRRHRHLHLHLRAGDRGVPPAVPLVAGGRDRRVRRLLRHRQRVLRRQRAEGAQPAAGCRWPSAWR